MVGFMADEQSSARRMGATRRFWIIMLLLNRILLFAAFVWGGCTSSSASGEIKMLRTTSAQYAAPMDSVLDMVGLERYNIRLPYESVGVLRLTMEAGMPYYRVAVVECIYLKVAMGNKSDTLVGKLKWRGYTVYVFGEVGPTFAVEPDTPQARPVVDSCCCEVASDELMRINFEPIVHEFVINSGHAQFLRSARGRLLE